MTASNLDLKILVVLTVATILAMVWVVIKGMDDE